MTCVLLGFFMNQTIDLNLDDSMDEKTLNTFYKVRNPVKCLHSCSYGKNKLDKNLLWICIQFLLEDLEQIRKLKCFKTHLKDDKFEIRRFVLRLWRNCINQMEMAGLWDIAISLIVLIQEGDLL